MATTKNRRKPKGELHRRTINEDLHKQWRRLERKGDTTELARLLNVSKPTIDKALIYGCVHQQTIVDGITSYFADRLMKEKEAAQGLHQMQIDADKAHSAIPEAYKSTR